MTSAVSGGFLSELIKFQNRIHEEKTVTVARFICCVFFSVSCSSNATFSIAACDKKTGICGYAVSTNNLAVGASVGTVVAKTGVVVSQFETHPQHGPRAFKKLADGQSTDSTLKHLLDTDGQFEGQGIEARQIAIVHISGQVSIHTGQTVKQSAWAGELQGDGYAIQGNGLHEAQVLQAMQHTFLHHSGSLAERLLSTLEAGEAAGGQASGALSAALMVKTPEGWPRDIDLRVDAAYDPVAELRKLMNKQTARQLMIAAERAFRKNKVDQANAYLSRALMLGYDWDRIWRRAARLAVAMQAHEQAVNYLSVFKAINPAWAAQEIQASHYDPLLKHPLFKQWRNEPE
ncbi:DUF1028 domain-containing protein [Marinicella sp. W31]|uniref:DUF1028 domain-containing protein n=1 Tax=Marinicella sp. W31 TaxID=3023713 RepID=UPI003757DEA2